jgi:hypothetical protein
MHEEQERIRWCSRVHRAFGNIQNRENSTFLVAEIETTGDSPGNRFTVEYLRKNAYNVSVRIRLLSSQAEHSDICHTKASRMRCRFTSGLSVSSISILCFHFKSKYSFPFRANGCNYVFIVAGVATRMSNGAPMHFLTAFDSQRVNELTRT